MKTSNYIINPELLKSSKIGAYELKAAMKTNAIKGFFTTNLTAITIAFGLLIAGVFNKEVLVNIIPFAAPIPLGPEVTILDENSKIPKDPNFNKGIAYITKYFVGEPIPIPESEIIEREFAPTDHITNSLSASEGKMIDSDYIENHEIASNNSTLAVNGVSEPAPALSDIPSEEMFFEVEPEVDMSSIYENIVYPELAIKARIEGRVMISVLIDEKGKPITTNIKQSTNQIFNSVAISAVLKAVYTPAFQDRKAVKSWIMIPITFKLK